MLNDNAVLDVKDAEINFSKLQIDYKNGSKIDVEEDLKVKMFLVTLNGLESHSNGDRRTIGIKTNKNSQITFTACDILDLTKGVHFVENANGHISRFSYCNFSRNDIGIVAERSHTLKVDHTDISGYKVGIQCLSLQKLSLSFSDIFDYKGELETPIEKAEGGIV